MKQVNNRREIIFLYDVTNSNPNGDPLDENKPRIDEESGKNLVSDVRLKRTIRDHLKRFKNKDIFIWTEQKSDGSKKTKEEIMDTLKVNSPNELLDKCIDIRLFGATIAIKSKDKKGKKELDDSEPEKKNITFTGPVQFKFGISLHKVETKFIKGTTVFPSKEGLSQGTFTEQYILPYSLISFYGIVNENAGKDTKLTEEDLELLYDGLWNGTKNLISRSKIGQMPRLLIEVIYNERNYHIGDLDKQIKLILNGNEIKNQEEIRSTEDYYLDLTKLKKTLDDNKSQIKEIRMKVDPNLKITGWYCDGEIKEVIIGG
ncbi:MAG: type I-B CRISPR-associated protein Cas7/Csh2 [Candidatus Eremiobacterota bacterium]